MSAAPNRLFPPPDYFAPVAPPRHGGFFMTTLDRTVMISPEFVAMLRCPLDTTVPVRLDLPEEGRDMPALVCTRCETRYLIHDGIPNMLPEDAVLPPGCPDLDRLPCRRRQRG